MRYILVCMLIGMVMDVYAQAIVRVKVLDSAGAALPNASISLIKSPSKQIVSNGITDSLGNGFFHAIAPGDYFISCSVAGTKRMSSPVFVVQSNESPALQIIRLMSNVQELTVVTITAKKPLLEASDDKIAYHIEKDLSLQGLSAADALAKVPFISVDGQGNVQLKGQTSFQILLNGKQTSMFASNPGEVLKSFPANMISKIEVITNPSAKYEGEGITGLINIITKKKVAGYNGHASLSYNTNGQINPNASFNMKFGKIGITSFLYYARNTGLTRHGFQQYMPLVKPSVFSRRQFTDTTHQMGYNAGGNLEVVYEIDSLQALSLYGRISNGGNQLRQRSHMVSYDESNDILQENLFITRDKADYPGGEAGIDYLRKFSTPGKFLSVTINRQFRRSNTLLHSDQYDVGSNDRFLENNARARNLQTSFQIDYTIPLASRSTIESGVRGILRNVNSTYLSKQKDIASGAFVADPANSNELNYEQGVIGAYTVYTYSVKEKKWLLKVGARVEKTTVNGHFISSNTTVEQDYYSFLPSFSFNKTFKNGKRFSFGFSRRLARPGLNFLNPFKDNRDPLFVSYGNERLRPEFATNIELGVSSFTSKINYSVTLNGSFVRNGIQRYLVFDNNTGISTQTYGNIGQTRLWGVNTYLSFNASQQFAVTVTGNLYYVNIKNSIAKEVSRKGLYGAINASLNYTISERFNLFNTISFNTSAIQLQGQNGNFLFYNIGGGYWLVKKKWMVNAGLMNPFNKYWRMNGVFTSSSVRQETSLWSPARAFFIGIRFSFGKLKESTSKKRGVTIDDMKQELN